MTNNNLQNLQIVVCLRVNTPFMYITKPWLWSCVRHLVLDCWGTRMHNTETETRRA